MFRYVCLITHKNVTRKAAIHIYISIFEHAKEVLRQKLSFCGFYNMLKSVRFLDHPVVNPVSKCITITGDL